MGDRLTVFISSTARDLQKYRAKVKDAVIRAGAYPMAMEEFDATDRNALQLCYDAVTQADVLVGIYAHRYGFAPDASMTYTTIDGDTRAGDGVTGITHWEYLWALERGIPVLLYVISDTDDDGEPMSWPVSAIEDEPGKSRLKDFKALIGGKHGVNFFTSPDGLAGKVGVAVAKIAAGRPSRAVEPVAKTVDKPLPDKTRTTNRANMLELVEQVWVTGYLDNVLNQHQALKIPMSFTDPEKVVRRPGLEDYTLPDSTQIVSAFHDLNERLVILGEPGAGKTVALAQLCKALIDEARADDTDESGGRGRPRPYSKSARPIPVILSLTSWAAEQPPFETWLRKELVDKYALPRKAADDFVLGEQLTYLLDGLDEVAESQRENCLKEIKTFFESERPLVQYALCSRRKEFMALETRLDVVGELVMQPLTDAQIDQYLVNDDFEGLRVLMNDNLILQGFARIPFMLNTMAVVARGQPERKLRLTLEDQDSAESLRDAFLEQYIQRRLEENPNSIYSNKKTIRHYLHWLAGQLVRHDQTDFYIENMQPDWLGNNTEKRHYRRNLRWVGGAAFGLASSVVFGLVVGLGGIPELGIVGGAIVGLAVGLAFSLGGDLPLNRIILAEQVEWSFTWGGLAVGLTLGLAFGLTVGLANTLTSALAIGLGFGLAGGLGVIWAVGRPFGLAFGIVFGLSVGLVTWQTGSKVVGLAGGLMFGLAGGWTGSLSPIEIVVVRLHPNTGLRRFLSSFLRVWLLITLAVGLVFGLAYGLANGWGGSMVYGLTGGLAFGLGIAMRTGGIDICAHLILRYYLARDGHIPRWRYDKFLDYAHELVILRKVGGGYRFVHDYLRQYLARSPFVPDGTVGEE